MTWRDVQPSKGILLAEGQGYSLSSSQVRGFGMLAYFTRNKAATKRDNTLLWAPSSTADSFAFGICPCDDDLKIPDLDISTDDKVVQLLDQWDCSRGKIHVKQHKKERDRGGVFGRVFYGFTLVVGIMAPFLPALDTPIFRAPHPQPPVWHQWSSPEEFHVFANRLAKFLEQEDSQDGGSSQRFKRLRWLREELKAQDHHDGAINSGIGTSSSPFDDCKKHRRKCIGDFARRERFKGLHA